MTRSLIGAESREARAQMAARCRGSLPTDLWDERTGAKSDGSSVAVQCDTSHERVEIETCQ